jgi:hypothetical protein
VLYTYTIFHKFFYFTKSTIGTLLSENDGWGDGALRVQLYKKGKNSWSVLQTTDISLCIYVLNKYSVVASYSLN